MIITDRIFKGIKPSIEAGLLGPGDAQTAENCDLSGGDLKPWDNSDYQETLESYSQVRTIYKYGDDDWLEFTADVDVAEGPISGDTAEKFYYTGDGIPKKSNRTEATTGSGAKPITFYPMEVPTPAHAPTAGAPGAGGSGDARDVTYVWTIVTSWGEESGPSDASSIVSPTQGQAVALSDMTLVWQASQAYTTDNWVVPSILGDYVYKCVTAGTSDSSEPEWGTTVDEDTEDGSCEWRCFDKGILFDSGAVKRIYRTNSGDETVEYQLLASIAMTATTYSDTTTDEDLESTILETFAPLTGFSWGTPPDDLSGLTAHGNGFFVGFSGKDVYCSVPGKVHAWPSDYVYPLPFTVVATKVIGATIVALTTQNPYLLVGTSPAALTPVKLADPAKCVAKRGAVVTPAGCIYPSNSGLELVTENGGQQNLFQIEGGERSIDKKDWASYYPSTLTAAYHEGQYIGFFSSGGNEGGIVVDLASGAITTLDFYAPAIYADPSERTLYFTDTSTDMFILESGTPAPSQTNALLLESGDNILME